MSISEPSPRLSRSAGSWPWLAAASAIGVASVSSPGAASILVAVSVALVLRQVVRPLGSSNNVRLIGIVVVVGVALSLQTGFVGIPDIGALGYLAWLGPPALTAAAMFVRGRTFGWADPLVAGVLIAAVAAAGVVVMVEHGGADVGTDVYLAHLAGAAAIADGVHPYSDAVQYPDGSPFAPEGAIFEGYAYPPLTLWAYAVTTWATGDPRWLNVIAWVGVLAFAGLDLYLKRRELLVPVLVVLAALPTWRLMVFAGWTEPITVALLVAAAAFWRGRTLTSGLLVGLALASKQYMVLLGPVLLFVRDSKSRLRAGIAVLTAIATLVPYFVSDPASLVEKMVLGASAMGFRTDSQSLAVWLGSYGPAQTVLGLLAVLAVGWLMGRQAPVPANFMVGVGLSIGAFFLLTLAFSNYWFLVASLVGLSVAFREPPKEGT